MRFQVQIFVSDYVLAMQILFLTHHDNFQGSSRSLLSLLEGIQADDLHPLVVVPKESPFTKNLAQHQIRVKVLPLPWWCSHKYLAFSKKLSLTKQLIRSIKTLQEIIQKHHINMVYTNSSVTPVGKLASWLKDIPHIWHIREFGDLDFSLKYIFPEWICQKFIRSSQAVICNSQAVRKHVFKNWHSPKLHVIYNGVASKEQFDQLFKQTLQRPQNEFYTFLIIGAISLKKGQQVAVKALAKLVKNGLQARLIIAGTGRDANVNHVKDLVKNLGISDYVDFLGYIQDPYEAYLKADCLLMCSEYEAFGRVTAEAMSACLPVIGRNSGGTPEVVADGETGILFTTFNELVSAMIKLVEDPDLGKQMGLAGWKRAKEMFNIEDYAANVYKVIQSVVEHK